MDIVDRYLEGVLNALPPEPFVDLAMASGASAAQLASLRQTYPLCPDSLLRLLGTYNGTYYQEYAGGTVLVYMLGSDVFEYPYYLSSVEQILQDGLANQRSIADIYGHYLEQDPGIVDARIDAGIKQGQRLCFSHCMNNGGSSRLYVDFTPTASGKVGQIVRFLHDPDNYKVIADSFDAYLQMLIDDDYAFLIEENFE
ncbi:MULTISPECIES: SMI1/KNR4 family protein [Janthinobacterium]|uniref:SMI1/KNR4 family protein n=1 Tax=Janthinobacterium TaxID=29580 RepID=UPI001B82F9D2|nr:MULTISPECIES: SMI1/KNR4 family protein [Janthinobacterium]MBR7633322.1 SMI1/KNR4 family protein [Janthinobacterium lividum]MCC7695257.1 SMI1/KNR4 family protein [Janthinobacterium sp. EB271-G4-7A]